MLGDILDTGCLSDHFRVDFDRRRIAIGSHTAPKIGH
jgi:hypothetical protein